MTLPRPLGAAITEADLLSGYSGSRLQPFVALLLLAACHPTHESEPKQETAEVMQLAYVPPIHGQTSGSWGSGGDGNFVYNFGSSTTTEAQWAVVFRCDGHSETFAITGKDIYSRVRIGQKVTLTYVDVLDGDNRVVGHHTRAVAP